MWTSPELRERVRIDKCWQLRTLVATVLVGASGLVVGRMYDDCADRVIAIRNFAIAAVFWAPSGEIRAVLMS